MFKIFQIQAFKFPAQYPYGNQTFLNDIVLIEVRDPFDFGQNVQPACLPRNSSSLDISNMDAFITGWGKTDYGMAYY